MHDSHSPDDSSAAPLLVCWAMIAAAIHTLSWLDASIDPAGPFMVRMGVAWLGWALACLLVRRGVRRGPALVPLVLVGGVLLRGLGWNAPILLETDVNRYLWDGFVLSEGFNPYQFAPSEVFRALEGGGEGQYREEVRLLLLELAERTRGSPLETHLEQINHPEIPTCYPPLTEFAFALSARLSPGDEVTWKALVAAVDMAVCGLVLLLLVRLGRDPTWVLFYAWCPLPVKEYANTGHFDPLATFFTVLAVWLLLERRSLLAGLSLGAGIASKLYPLVLVPVLWRRLGWRGILATGVLPLLLLAPFLGIGLHVFDGLVAFAKDWEFNSSLFALVNSFLDSGWVPGIKLTTYARLSWVDGELMMGDHFQEFVLDGFFLSKLVTSALLGVLVLLLMRWPEDEDWSVPGRALAALAGLLLLSPVTDPWYLPWLLPYACLFPFPSWLFLTGSIQCYYAYFLEWTYLWWHRPLEYLPFYLLLALELPGILARNPELFPWGMGSPREAGGVGSGATGAGEGASGSPLPASSRTPGAVQSGEDSVDNQDGCERPPDGSEWL